MEQQQQAPAQNLPEIPQKRGRGRPKKIIKITTLVSKQKPKNKVGRPRKISKGTPTKPKNKVDRPKKITANAGAPSKPKIKVSRPKKISTNLVSSRKPTVKDKPSLPRLPKIRPNKNQIMRRPEKNQMSECGNENFTEVPDYENELETNPIDGAMQADSEMSNEEEDDDDNNSCLHVPSMGPLYRHEWNPLEQPIGILGVAVYKNTLLHAVKIGPASSIKHVSLPQTQDELLADINSSNVVIVRADTMKHTFPELTLKYYESNVKFVNQAKPPDQVASDAARAVLLTKGVGDTDCNLEQLFDDMLPSNDDIDAPSTGASSQFALKRQSSDDDEKVKRKVIAAVDKFGLPVNYISSSSSDEDDFEEDVKKQF